MSPFRDFSELVLKTNKDRDYHIHLRQGSSEIVVTAVHGGGVEPLTSEVAAAIAGDEHSLYDLQGIRPANNDELRIPVANYDEMRLRFLLERSQVCLSVEGVEGSDLAVHLGGRNRRLRTLLAERLQEAGFKALPSFELRAAHNPMLFFNTPADGGVQIELSRALRENMVNCPLASLDRQNELYWTACFHALIAAARTALADYRAESRSDLDRTMAHFERVTEAMPASLRSRHHHQHDA